VIRVLLFCSTPALFGATEALEVPAEALEASSMPLQVPRVLLFCSTPALKGPAEAEKVPAPSVGGPALAPGRTTLALKVPRPAGLATDVGVELATPPCPAHSPATRTIVGWASAPMFLRVRGKKHRG
jgi:hypothetical protein